MVDKGVSWNVGKVFFRDELVYRFDLLPEPGHERPAFINLQQYYVEGYLAERAARRCANLELRWKNKVVGLDAARRSTSTLTVETPDGPLPARGRLRRRLRRRALERCAQLMGLESKGRVFHDRFLIADSR